MKILCAVNQTAALRRGIDAPSSTCTVEVDPAALTQDERDVLAAVLVDGHDARGPLYEPAEFGRQSVGSLVLVQPYFTGLREAVADLIRIRDEYRVHLATLKCERRERADERARIFIAANEAGGGAGGPAADARA